MTFLVAQWQEPEEAEAEDEDADEEPPMKKAGRHVRCARAARARPVLFRQRRFRLAAL